MSADSGAARGHAVGLARSQSLASRFAEAAIAERQAATRALKNFMRLHFTTETKTLPESGAQTGKPGLSVESDPQRFAAGGQHEKRNTERYGSALCCGMLCLGRPGKEPGRSSVAPQSCTQPALHLHVECRDMDQERAPNRRANQRQGLGSVRQHRLGQGHRENHCQRGRGRPCGLERANVWQPLDA